MDKDGYHGYYKFEHSPQRKWVGLTDDEIKQMGLDNYRQVVREVEAKLKEKNT